MDLNQLANLGEFIGGIAVLVTLIYLAIQVRGNTASLRYAARQSLAQQNVEYTKTWLRDPALATQHFRLYKHPDFDNASADDLRLSGLFYCIMQNMASQRHAWRLGILDDAHWLENEAHAAAYANSPEMRKMWNAVGRTWFDDDFVAFFDAMIERAKTD